MKIERLRKIIAYSEEHCEEMNTMVKRFCVLADVEYDTNILSILQIARASLRRKGFLVLELPFADDEIGALCYKGDGLGYVVINTSLPRVNVNFAVAHEIYHVFFGEYELAVKVEFSDVHGYEHEEEYAANLFAGMLLMPENSFRRMYLKFKEEAGGNEIDILVQLMAYYQAPYMAVLVRSLELGLISENAFCEQMITMNRAQMKQRLTDLWLDESILDASDKDDYTHLERMVAQLGSEYVKDEYINARALDRVLHNMRELYTKIKGA